MVAGRGKLCDCESSRNYRKVQREIKMGLREPNVYPEFDWKKVYVGEV
jgi:hypothetical protein